MNLTVPDVIAHIHATMKYWLEDEIAALRDGDAIRARECKLLAACLRKLADDLAERQAAA